MNNARFEATQNKIKNVVIEVYEKDMNRKEAKVYEKQVWDENKDIQEACYFDYIFYLDALVDFRIELNK